MLAVVRVYRFLGIAVDTIMKTLFWARGSDIDDPAMEALPLWMGVGEIMESGAFPGY